MHGFHSATLFERRMRWGKWGEERWCGGTEGQNQAKGGGKEKAEKGKDKGRGEGKGSKGFVSIFVPGSLWHFIKVEVTDSPLGSGLHWPSSCLCFYYQA